MSEIHPNLIIFGIAAVVMVGGVGYWTYRYVNAKPYRLTDTEGHVRPRRSQLIQELVMSFCVVLVFASVWFVVLASSQSMDLRLLLGVSFAFVLCGLVLKTQTLPCLRGTRDIRWDAKGISGPSSDFFPKQVAMEWQEILRFKQYRLRRWGFSLKAKDGRKIIWDHKFAGFLEVEDAIKRHRPDLVPDD